MNKIIVVVIAMNYCPSCGNKLKDAQEKQQPVSSEMVMNQPGVSKKAWLNAAGILTIIASALCGIVIIACLIQYIQTGHSYHSNSTYRSIYLFVSLLGCFALTYGLLSAILMFFKKFHSIVISSLVVLILTSLATAIGNEVLFLFIGLPILILTVCSHVLVAGARQEFVS
jgi:hypothetical protein